MKKKTKINSREFEREVKEAIMSISRKIGEIQATIEIIDAIEKQKIPLSELCEMNFKEMKLKPKNKVVEELKICEQFMKKFKWDWQDLRKYAKVSYPKNSEQILSALIDKKEELEKIKAEYLKTLRRIKKNVNRFEF